MSFLVDIVSGTLLMGGIFLVLVGGIGILRMPDFFTRVHAAGITDTLGAGLVLAGLMFQGGFSQVTIKLILILAFLLFTSPTSTHALAKAALADNLRPLLDEGGSSSRS